MQTKGVRQSLIRVASIIVMFWIIVGSSNDAIARKLVGSLRQELAVEERLEAEKRLWTLGYWAGPADGRFDSASRHALVAFQKVERRPLTGSLTREELDALRNAVDRFRNMLDTLTSRSIWNDRFCSLLMKLERLCASCRFPPAIVSYTWTMVRSTGRGRQLVRSRYCGRLMDGD